MATVEVRLVEDGFAQSDVPVVNGLNSVSTEHASFSTGSGFSNESAPMSEKAEEGAETQNDCSQNFDCSLDHVVKPKASLESEKQQVTTGEEPSDHSLMSNGNKAESADSLSIDVQAESVHSPQSADDNCFKKTVSPPAEVREIKVEEKEEDDGLSVQKQKVKGKKNKIKLEKEESPSSTRVELKQTNAKQVSATQKTGKAETKKRKIDKVTKVSGKKPKKEETEVVEKKKTKGKGVKKEAAPLEKKAKKAKTETETEIWRWWEEGKKDDSIKWTFLEHRGPVFAPDYELLPDDVKFYYADKVVHLNPEAEEVATFYAKMLDHEYTTKEVFNKNFFHDWRKTMTPSERELIVDLKLCNFREICDYFLKKTEERKAMSKEEKQLAKDAQEKIRLEYGVAVIDGHKEKIGNFKIEPPGLFRGRGVHPKMGKLKRRIQPENVIINCSKDSKIPQPPDGHKWKEVRHDNKVSWLASWTENIMGSNKYVMLNPSSKIKGEKDWEKYELARKLKDCVEDIRANYRTDWKSKETRIRQRAVALYFIDKLALRAGHEKEDNETADTVGCCSLRCEHIKLHDELDGQKFVVEFDFLGKDSIRYYNRVPVEKRVFRNLKIFMENKTSEDELFDRLSSSGLNKHLQSLMDGLTAKVFRTFNASITLQEQLDLLTQEKMNPAEKLLAYNRANRQVAILCNHQRSVPKAHGQQMENMQKKIEEKETAMKEAKKAIKTAKADHKASGTPKTKKVLDQKEKTLHRLEEQLLKLKVKATDKEENKEIALGTSKLNYLDPRITVAWCKKNNIAVERVYNKTQREKFRWAVDMAGPDFSF